MAICAFFVRGKDQLMHVTENKKNVSWYLTDLVKSHIWKQHKQTYLDRGTHGSVNSF